MDPPEDDDDEEGGEEDDDDDQESMIETMLKSDRFSKQKREPIKISRPTREELDSARDEKNS